MKNLRATLALANNQIQVDVIIALYYEVRSLTGVAAGDDEDCPIASAPTRLTCSNPRGEQDVADVGASTGAEPDWSVRRERELAIPRGGTRVGESVIDWPAEHN